MTDTRIWAHYLADDLITFRPPEEEDAAQSVAWYDGSFPVTPARALDVLKESETFPWGQSPHTRLICGRIADGEIVGGAVVQRDGLKIEDLRLTPSRLLDPEQQGDIASRMLRVLTPWLLDEIAVSSVVIRIPADETRLIQTATALGYRQNGRYREHVLRSHGFVDLLLLQVLNPKWTLPRAERSGDA
jgi:RimJ/RimL family protein N-acetyltransferase